jgi:hypothetical protein
MVNRIVAMALLLAAVPAMAQEPQKENDGTDPTRPINQARLSYEHVDLRNGLRAENVVGFWDQPFGDGYWISRVRVPFVATNALGDASLGLGDASFRIARVLSVSKKGGNVFQMEIIAPTAGRDEWGQGKWQLKPTFIQAFFLKDGMIIAPSLLHQFSFAGSSRRADVNVTTFDLYIVPKLANNKLFMTIDPAINYDWERKDTFGALAVTLGYNTGKFLGGQGQVFVKPATGIGGDRPFNWSIMAGVSVLGF